VVSMTDTYGRILGFLDLFKIKKNKTISKAIAVTCCGGPFVCETSRLPQFI
jgi:hypothetical protein